MPYIVTSEWLADELDSVVVIDTRPAREFVDGHVPGAISLPLGSVIIEDSSPLALRRLGIAVQTALSRAGIEQDARIVLIDDGDGSASYGVFLCEVAGVSEAAAVHGGMRAWRKAAEALEFGPTTRSSTQFTIEPTLATVATIDDMKDAERLGLRMVDTRSQLEHEGIVGTPCCSCRGHIPGSLHLEWVTLLSATGDLHGPDRIREEAQRIGLTPEHDIVVYCHSGHRSAVAGLALRAAGFTKTRNSLGSWHEWCLRDLPVAPER
jgi:thiosulfate/3-mercaptopyruvate sulfurtransferase